MTGLFASGWAKGVTKGYNDPKIPLISMLITGPRRFFYIHPKMIFLVVFVL